LGEQLTDFGGVRSRKVDAMWLTDFDERARERARYSALDEAFVVPAVPVSTQIVAC